MRDILSRTQLRRLELIEKFFYHSNWIDIKNLTIDFKQSERTIHNDVLMINSDYPYIEITRVNKHYRMKISPEYDIQKIYQDILNNNIILNIIEELLYRPIKTLNEMSQEFYVSSSTLYRNIAHINPILKKKYNIQLSNTPYELKGLETDIRYFYAQFISEKYPVQVWPFKGIDEYELQEFILYFSDSVGIQLDFASLRLVKIITAINILRLLQGHYIETVKTDTTDLLKKIEHLESYQHQKNYLKDNFGFILDEDLFDQIFVSYTQEDFLYTFEDLIQKAQGNSYIKKSIDQLKDILVAISKDFDLPIPNRKQLLLDMHNTSHLEKQEINSNYILYDRKGDFARSLETLCPKFFKRIKSDIIKYRKEINQSEDPIMINHLIYTLFTHWEDLTVGLERKKQAIYILVISDYDARHSKMLVDTVNYFTSEQVIVEAIAEMNIDFEAIEASKYDIIVSNFHLENNANMPHVYVKDIPTEENFDELNNLISQISKQRGPN